MKYILFIFFLIIILALSVDLLLKQPSIWPDEAIWYDIVTNFLKDGRLSTNLWKGTLPYIEDQALWFPSLFFYTISGWFYIFGGSIESQRALSSFFGLLILITLYFFSKSLSLNKKQSVFLSLTVICATFTDYTFFTGSKISRPEIMILFYSLASLLLLKYSNDLKDKRVKYLFLVLSGLLVGLACVHHVLAISLVFIGTLCLVFANGTKKEKIINILIFLFSLSAPVCFWFLSIRNDINIFLEQSNAIFQRKNYDDIWFVSVFKEHSLNLKITYLLYVLGTLYFLIKSYAAKKKVFIFVALPLIIFWFFNFYGKLGWYFIYITPFIYLALCLLVFQPKVNKFALVLLILLIASNLYNLIFGISSLAYSGLLNTLGDNKNYDYYCAKILEKVPNDTSVYLSAIPDPYYCFKKAGRNNYLTEFPVTSSNGIKPFKDIISKTDYIVLSAFFENIPFGDFLPKYLEKNIEKVETVTGNNQYNVNIIKLKLKNERI